jgi:DNA gyrase subunit A
LDELAQKRKRAKEIQKLLDDEPARWQIIRAELKQIAQTFGDPRRTRIEVPAAPLEFREEDYIVDEDSWVIVTRDGWTKRQKSFTDVASIRVRDDDRVGWIYRARARQTLTFFTDRGVAYTLRVNDLPMTTGHGEPIQKQFAFEDQEHIVGVVCHDPRCLPDPTKYPQTGPRLVQRLLGGDLDDLDDGPDPRSHDPRSEANGNGALPALPPPPYAVALTAGGKVLRFALAPLAAVSTRKGRLVVRLDPSVVRDLVVGVEATHGSENICLATRSARVLIFPVTEANIVAGAARGVNAIRLESKDRVIGFVLANKKREGLTVRTNRGALQIVRATKYPVTSRGGKGYAILQRGSLDAVVPDEAEPVPGLEEFVDGGAARNDPDAPDQKPSSSANGKD